MESLWNRPGHWNWVTPSYVFITGRKKLAYSFAVTPVFSKICFIAEGAKHTCSKSISSSPSRHHEHAGSKHSDASRASTPSEVRESPRKLLFYFPLTLGLFTTACFELAGTKFIQPDSPCLHSLQEAPGHQSTSSLLLLKALPFSWTLFPPLPSESFPPCPLDLTFHHQQISLHA